MQHLHQTFVVDKFLRSLAVMYI